MGEIERMVQEAEEFAEEDKKTKERIDGRNGLEGYCYNLKNMLEDEEKGIADKISEEDNEAKQKEVEAIANPIIQTVYQEGGAGGDDEDDEEEEDDEDEL